MLNYETASMLNYEKGNYKRNGKYYFNVKVETASMRNYENRKSKYA